MGLCIVDFRVLAEDLGDVCSQRTVHINGDPLNFTRIVQIMDDI